MKLIRTSNYFGEQSLRLSIVIIMLLFITGCSSTFRLSNFSFKQKFYNNFNGFAKNKKVDILLEKDSLITNQGEVVIKDDSIYSTEGKNIASINRLESIMYNNKLRGALYGSIIGAISGFAVSYTVSNFINRNNPDKKSLENGYIALSGIPLGAIVGIIWGWIEGYHYTYQFNP